MTLMILGAAMIGGGLAVLALGAVVWIALLMGDES